MGFWSRILGRRERPALTKFVDLHFSVNESGLYVLIPVAPGQPSDVFIANPGPYKVSKLRDVVRETSEHIVV